MSLDNWLTLLTALAVLVVAFAAWVNDLRIQRLRRDLDRLRAGVADIRWRRGIK